MPTAADPAPIDSPILLTRRRWDWYCLPLFIFALLFGIAAAWHTQQWRFALAPAGILPFWLLLRMLTPKAGLRSRSIRETPGALPLLLWLSFCLLLLVTAAILRGGLQEPMAGSDWVVFPGLLVIMLGGAGVIEQRVRRQAADLSEANGL